MIDAARRAPAVRRRDLALAAAAAGAAAVIAADPHRQRALLPRCPVKLITGLDCPSCGGLRLAHDLLHADIRAAVHDNAFLLVCSPLLVTLGLRGAAAQVPRGAAYTLGSAALLWMIVRNLPAWPLKPTVRR